MNRKATGDRAELLACRYLKRHGLRLLTRNFHCRRGEIDLVMRDGDSLVFVEVRYRQQTRFGHAAETVTHAKQNRIIYCARYYMTVHQNWNMPARFDVVAMEGNLDDVSLQWFANAFQPGG
ncbi:MAG TPA: YraN family protein [Gammaproteobacteria bacterium]|nr:YraN family protein [Gammaproteobacteria bacterium]